MATDTKSLASVLTKIAGRNICVIGEAILDHYLIGDSNRIASEAPIPVTVLSEEKYYAGAAPNVAANIIALGGNADLFTFVGDDANSEILLNCIKDKHVSTEHVVRIKGAKTIEKTRLISQDKQVARFDVEYFFKDCEKQRNDIIKYVLKNIEKWNAIVFSDYRYGLLTEDFVQQIVAIAKDHGIFVMANAKPCNINIFKNCNLVSANIKEAFEVTKCNDITNAGITLQKLLDCNILITQGKDGMTLFEGEYITNIPVDPVYVHDVIGAGDTVVSMVALAVSAGATLYDAGRLGNCAGRLAVSKFGIDIVTTPEILKSLDASSSLNLN